MSSFRMQTICLAAALAAALSGCGSRYQPASGKIVFTDGSPVKGLGGGQIIFQPVNAAAGNAKSVSGAIDDNGNFTLGTETTDDGAPEGEYQPVITPPQPTGDVPLPAVIDPKYTKAGGFTETFTVKTGKNEFTLKVEPPPQ